MDVVQAGEALDDAPELLADHLLRKLDLARVEGSDSADLEAATDLGRQLAVGGAQDNVDELGRVGDLGDVLPSGVRMSAFVSRRIADFLYFLFGLCVCGCVGGAYWVFMTGDGRALRGSRRSGVGEGAAIAVGGCVYATNRECCEK